MKAIRVREFGDANVMKMEDVSDLTPSAGQVVVQVKAAGINPVDTYIRSGVYPSKPELPYTPGMDAAGIVASVGEGVSRLKPGDRVYVAGSLSGTYAEQALCTESQVHPLADGVSFEQGAGVYVPYATAYRALWMLARMRPGETLLVHGASGGVGIAAIQFAKSSGVRVIGTAGTEKGKQLAAEQGADHVVDHNQDGYLDEIRALTDGKGPNIILEMLSNVNLQNDLEILAQRGRIVVIGCRGDVQINPRLIMGKEAQINGMVLMLSTEQELSVAHCALVAGLESGVLRPVVGQTFPLADAAQAHEAVLKPGAYGKIVLQTD
ncbi:MAG: NADPH:quinone reductase [Candidatus Hinthialibacter antarcticus]|nr:NADPH:quinone reductase [Candidatus Hinthialibacter antarcticus]